MTSHRTLFQVSEDTLALEAYLRRHADVGQFVSYGEMSQLIGRDVQDGARGNLTTARNRLMRDGIAFGPVFGKGLKCLGDEEIVAASSSSRTRIRNLSRKGLKLLSCVSDFESMSQASRARHCAEASVLAATNLMLNPTYMKKLAYRVENTKQLVRLPLERTLHAFLE